MSTLADDLRAARALIDTPEKWIKGDWFEGTRCCAAGAARKVLRDAGHRAMIGFWATPLAHALDEAAGGNIVAYNDDPATTHNDILALFDRAISNASQPETK